MLLQYFQILINLSLSLLRGLGVSAPSEAWCILQGESPCRVRISHPPVSSVAPVAETRFASRTKQVKRTQRIMQAAGETALPEVLVSLRDKLVPGCRGL